MEDVDQFLKHWANAKENGMEREWLTEVLYELTTGNNKEWYDQPVGVDVNEAIRRANWEWDL